MSCVGSAAAAGFEMLYVAASACGPEILVVADLTVRHDHQHRPV